MQLLRRRLALSIPLVGVLAFVSPPARAEDANAAERRLRLALQTGLLLGITNVEEGSGDLISQGSAGVALDFSIAPSYRAFDTLALGVRAGVAGDLGDRGEASSSGATTSFGRTLWHLAASGRYQPSAGSGWYLSLEGGAAAIVDSRGDDSLTQWGPLLGAAIGYDIRLAAPVSFGIELQGVLVSFDANGAELVHEGYATTYQYGSSGWLGLAVVGALGI